MSSGPTLRRLWVLMATVFVDMVGFLMVLPLLPFYAERMGADPFTVGLLISSFAVAQLASSPLWGRFSDRFGRRPAILVGLLASSVAYVLFAFADSVWLLLLSRLVQGAGGGTTGVAQAYVADAVPAEQRTQALGWLSAATSAGVMIGPAIGSLSASLGPAAPGLIAAGLCLLNAGFAAFSLPESSDRSAPRKERKPIRESVRRILVHPGETTSLLVWIYAIGMMAFMGMNGVLALFLERRFGFDEKSIGWLYVYVGSISLVMRGALLGVVLRRLGELPTLRLGAISLCLGLAVMPLPVHLWQLAVVVVLVPVGTALLFPATSSLISRYAPEGEVGQTLGVQQAFGGVCRMLGPMAAGAAFQYLSISAPFFLASGLMAGAVLLTMRLNGRQPGGDTEPAPGLAAG